MSAIVKEIKEQIITYARIMEECGMANTYEGNVSIKYNDRIYITPSKIRKALLTEAAIAELDLDGNQIAGEKKASSESLMHSEAYKMRSDVSSVIHSHPTFLTAYALRRRPVVTKAYPEHIVVFKEIPVVEYGRPSTSSMIVDRAKTLCSYDIVLLASHGVLTVGKNLPDTFALLEAGEAIAKVLSITALMGGEVPLEKDEYDYLYSL